MKKEDCYFIFTSRFSICYYMFKNVLKKGNYFCLYRYLLYCQADNKIVYTFERCINKIYKTVANVFFNKLQYKKLKGKTVIISNCDLERISKENLLKIKKHSNKLVLFFIDELFNDYQSMINAKQYYKEGLFDLVYTFSEYDAKKYGMNYISSYYSKMCISEKKIKSDIFFVGNLKDRRDLLVDLNIYFNEVGIKSDFVIVNSSKKDFNKKIKKMPIDYANSLVKMVASNCILDIADRRQHGKTLRYFEAVVYNKKLLTNNKNIKTLPYYNDKYMKVFETIEDIKNIDLQWFKSDEKFDYGYKGEFEPKYFIKDLCEKDF